MSGMPESWSLPWHKLQRNVAAGVISIAPAGSWLVRDEQFPLGRRF